MKVATSVWMHQLQFLKEEIINKFNQYSGRDPVSALYFSLGEVPSAQQTSRRVPPAPVAAAPLKSRDQRIIKESVAVIADRELKDILERVMTKDISRRRLREKKQDR